MLRERLTKVIEGEVFEANDTQQSTARLDLSEITDVEPREEADENSL
jgi:hypothetical protein